MSYNLTDYPFNKFQEMVKETPTVILPVGIIEQHGHHLPLGVDVFNCTEPLRIGADRLNCFIAPGFHYCFSGGGIQGTMNTNPQIFGLAIQSVCSEFIRMGFKNIILFLGHGGTENKESMKMGIQQLLADERNKDIAVLMISTGSVAPVMQKFFSMEPEHDFHAGWTETARMMYWRPDLVHMEDLAMDDPEISRMMRTDQDWYEHKEKAFDHPDCVERVTQRKEIKVGVMGFPEKATRELGEQICNEIIDGLEKLVNDLNARVKK